MHLFWIVLAGAHAEKKCLRLASIYTEVYPSRGGQDVRGRGVASPVV